MMLLLPCLFLAGAYAQQQVVKVVGKPVVEDDVESNADFGQVKRPEFSVQDLPEVASQVVGGFVKNFLNKDISAVEDECLQDGTKSVAQDVVLVASHVVMLTQELLGSREGLPDLGHFAKPVTTSKPSQEFLEKNGLFSERRLEEEENFLMDTSHVIIELGVSLQKVSALSHQVAHGCLQEDGVKALSKAAEHALNTTYLGHRVIIDGADMMEELAEATRRWNSLDRKGFGREMGKVFRRLLFGGTHDDDIAPSKWPTDAEMMNISEAFLASFFGPGFELDFRPLFKNHVQDEFKINLHKCFGRNAGLLEKLWASLTEITKSQLDRRNSVSHKDRAEANQELKDTLTFDLMQVPAALAKCNLGPEKQQMLEDAYLGVGTTADALAISIKGPISPTAMGVQNQLDSVLVHYYHLKQDGGVGFGHALGKLAQELAIWAFPRKYALDGFGNLRLQQGPVAQYFLAWVSLAFLTAALPAACRRRNAGAEATPTLLDQDAAEVA